MKPFGGATGWRSLLRHLVEKKAAMEVVDEEGVGDGMSIVLRCCAASTQWISHTLKCKGAEQFSKLPQSEVAQVQSPLSS